MTLRELERLIRRIEESLDRPVTDGMQKLAGDYAAAGRAAVTRLDQCAAMLDRGEDYQALQLAESQPPLLDFITWLSFRRSPHWLALCRAENWPTPERLDVKAVRRLNELYSRGIDKDHALYRDYRRTVMTNDDSQALVILRSIVRLNPNDQNARGEFERLESKVRTDKVRDLERLLRAGGDREKIASLTEEVEAAHVKVEPALWDKAQTIRASVLMERAHEARKAGDLRNVQRGLNTLDGLRNRLEPADRAALDELERWADAETQRIKEEVGRRAAVDHLTTLVHRLASELGGRKKSLPTLRAALTSLENAWRQVERLRTQISPELSTETQRLRDTLNAAIGNRARKVRGLVFAAVATFLLICLLSGWFAYSRRSAKAFAAKLEFLMQERRVAEVESLAAAPFKPEVANFLRRERELKAVSDKALKDLESTNAEPEQIAARFQNARHAIASLAPEFQSEAAGILVAKEAHWNDFVARERIALTTKLVSMLEPLEATALRELQFNLPPDRVVKSARQLRGELEPAKKLAETPVIKPNQEALFRFQNLQATIEKVLRDATNWFAAKESLASATNWQTYNTGLQQVMSSGFTPATQREAAGKFAALNLSSKTVLAPLLLPRAPNSLLDPVASPTQVPQNVLPGEREIFVRLEADQNIHAISRMDVVVKALQADDPRRKRVLFLRGDLRSRITRKSGQIYDPVESPAVLSFVEKEMGSLEYSLEEPITTAERDLYNRSGLSGLLDPNIGTYQASLLPALDLVVQDRRASPLFRAYLFSAICEIMDQQPAQWGAVWSPSLPKDRAELTRLGARQIRSGDWMIPAKFAQYGPTLAAQFERMTSTSYARESTFFKRLLSKAIYAGAQVLGYVSEEGNAVVRASENEQAVWGFTSISKPAEVVSNGKIKGRALPFSPLFVFGGHATTLIEETSNALSYSPEAVGIPETLPEILKGAP